MLKSHISNYHQVVINECDQCDFKTDFVKDFVKHILKAHKHNTEIILCPHCDYKAFDIQTINEHLENDHVELSLLGHVAANQNAASKNFDKFKDELTDILKAIIQENISIKQELFILRQNKHESNESIGKIEKAVVNLTNILTACKASSSTPKSSMGSSSAPLTPEPRKTNNSEPTLPKVPKVCVIGDSISGNLDCKVIANAMKAEVRASRAYSSINNSAETEATVKTKFPDKNFDLIINAELKKAQTDILIVQSGSVDVTNMKTNNDNTKKYAEYFKQQAILSATSLFNSISNAINSNPDLQEVILLKQTPR